MSRWMSDCSEAGCGLSAEKQSVTDKTMMAMKSKSDFILNEVPGAEVGCSREIHRRYRLSESKQS